jgi:photosystem II stability/assembly factor-like uncharacterized protein
VARAANKTLSAGSQTAAQATAQPRISVAPTAQATGVANVSNAPRPARRFVLVVSPDHSVTWALEDSGTIFGSTDHKTWQKQDSGVTADLLAGQALSSKVCWVVGRSGTILLTTDGERWVRIKSPTDADLVGVSAISSDVVNIVTANGVRFHSFDAGSNWQRIN